MDWTMSDMAIGVWLAAFALFNACRFTVADVWIYVMAACLLFMSASGGVYLFSIW